MLRNFRPLAKDKINRMKSVNAYYNGIFLLILIIVNPIIMSEGLTNKEKR